MTGSTIHPKVRQRLATTVANRKLDISDRQRHCIESLENALAMLRELDCPAECERISLLIELYTWALEEIRESDPAGSLDSNRVAAVGRVLELCTMSLSAMDERTQAHGNSRVQGGPSPKPTADGQQSAAPGFRPAKAR